MALLTVHAIQDLKAYALRNIVKARYKVGNTYYDAPIDKKEYLPDGRAAVYFTIDHTLPGDITINQIQLFDMGGQLWAQKTESILREDVQEGVLYRFTFDITEV
ncbi:hypothetical protein FACS18949_02880 [Clostridia bacterium]|nr:hypothetical protein FACS18949_02880 [Clostridia bacterium]